MYGGNNMRKVTRNIIVLTLILVMTIAPVLQVSAGEKFYVSYLSTDCKTVSFTIKNVSDYSELQVFKYTGKLFKKSTRGMHYHNIAKLKKKKAYYARYRQTDYEGSATSGWSKKLGFVTYNNYKAKLLRSKRWVYYKMPKIKGVKKFKVEISKKRNKGFKKVKNVKPGKKVYLKGFRGKKFKYYKNYYVRITPIVKGCKNNTSFNDGFYVYKTYRFR